MAAMMLLPYMQVGDRLAEPEHVSGFQADSVCFWQLQFGTLQPTQYMQVESMRCDSPHGWQLCQYHSSCQTHQCRQCLCQPAPWHPPPAADHLHTVQQGWGEANSKIVSLDLSRSAVMLRNGLWFVAAHTMHTRQRDLLVPYLQPRCKKSASIQ